MRLLVLICYDALALLILLLLVNRGAKRGFAETVTAVAGRIAAFFGALFLGKAGSQLIYDLFLGRKIRRFLREAIGSSSSAGEVLESISEAADALPDFIRNFYGLSDQGSLGEALESSLHDAVQALEEQLVEPAVTGFLHILIFLISFALLCLLVRYLSKAVGVLFQLPVIQTLDRFLGGVLGLAEGCIDLYLLALVLRLVLYFIPDPPLYFNEGMILDTVLWSRVYGFDPFAFLK